jgi:protein tyrosine phosphatase (PTP) superfamily phosphohydrolase (DUF442 family)
VLTDENKRLQGISLNKPIDLNDEKVIPTKVENELKLVRSQRMSYIRIPVTDGRMPTNDMVDYFVRLMNSKPQNIWLHFHCKGGAGRTTTFMIMFDMMKNSKEVSAEDIIERQVLLANLSTHSRKSFYSEERISFLNNFYRYCRKNADSFKTTWPEWISRHL